MKTTRRHLLERTSLATLGGLLPSCASASVPPSLAEPGGNAQADEYQGVPLPFDPTQLTGLSEQLLRSHHDNNYVAAVEKLNGVRQRLKEVGPDAPGYVLGGLAQGELAFKHSVVLHELYFGHLVGGGSSGSMTRDMLSKHFGGAPEWERRFRALGLSLGGGSGWAILEYDLHEKRPRMYTAADHSQGLSSGVPLIVLDMYEHSYHMDYGTAAAKYIDAFFANLHWEEVDRRTTVAMDACARREQ